MAVYVDKLRTYPDELLARNHLSHKKWCHLVADTPQELEDFAIKLGLKTLWKQGPFLHFDLTEGKRIQAVKMGAEEITDKELVTLIRKRRNE